ncbi:restriction endonuclease subunit S [Zwartia vadi]|uniref:restriction endonuclease subunit S n=1 Tax=Zwartia vadi TaxID=3058168 RepID=UPI0025B492BB|nr:restriction endonuclease subunit S [Zwartia vadi]MDN3987026.1 restriction endonuclease subunit S [Zwartia vadi]
MQQIPRHTEYRASGLAWVGDIPSHWQTRRNRFLFREVDSRSVHGQETHLSMSQIHGLVPSQSLGRKSLQSESYAGGKLVAESDLVLNRLKAHLGVFARAKQTGVISPDYSVFRSKSDVSVPYCELLFKTPFYVAEFRRRTKGIVEGFWRLYTDDFYDVSALIPPRTEQDQIVAYLRAQDVHIARLIKVKRDLIALLIEQKLRIIDHAVTRGINASVALKPSGIEWLGDVPNHWDVALVKHVADVRFSGVDKHSHDHEIPVRLCNYTDVYKNDKITDNMDLMRATATAGEIARLTLKAGDVIITKDSETPDDIAVPAWVPEGLPGVVCAYHLGLLRPDPGRIEGEFLFRAIGSARIAEQFHLLATGVTRFALGKHDVKNAVIALPPVEEQKAICKWIDDECKPLEDAIQRAEEEIKLIREYRDRQIADVVTGQVDVRGWVPGPDDVVTEEALAALGGDEEIDTDGEEDDGDD